MMAVLGPRDFECLLCGKSFTQISGDLLVPGPDICDACLALVWPLEGDTLQQYIAQHLRHRERGVPGMGTGEAFVARILQYIQDLKQHHNSLGALQQARAQQRGMFGNPVSSETK